MLPFKKPCSHQVSSTYLGLLSIFVAVLLLTNVIVTKHFTLGPFVLTAGAITYPFTFSLLDIIAEIYGPKRARLAVWMGLVGSLLMTMVLQLIIHQPSFEHDFVNDTAFRAIFGFTPGIVIGSMVAYLTAQFIDIHLFMWARNLTNSKHLWFRNNLSTLVSQFVDTLLFGLVAWILWPFFTWDSAVVPISWAAWWQITINEYAFKVVFTILNTPLVYGGVYIIKSYHKHKAFTSSGY